MGPVLESSARTDAIVTALQSLNQDLQIVSRGSYLRVTALHRCLLTAASVEAVTGQAFRLPNDLETVMTSFTGRFSVNDERAVWESVEAS